MEELKEKLEALLREAGVEISIGGCGCCGSPWIEFVADGVVYETDYLSVNTINMEER